MFGCHTYSKNFFPCIAERSVRMPWGSSTIRKKNRTTSNILVVLSVSLSICGIFLVTSESLDEGLLFFLNKLACEYGHNNKVDIIFNHNYTIMICLLWSNT